MPLLYEVPRNTRVRLTGSSFEFNFHHIDGAYSLCTNDAGEMFHIGASTPVEVVVGLTPSVEKESAQHDRSAAT